MKKIVALLLGLTLLFCFPSCGRRITEEDKQYAGDFKMQNKAFYIIQSLSNGDYTNVYYGYEYVTEASLYVALFSFYECEGIELTLEDVAEYLSERREDDKSIRIYTNNNHPLIYAYITWFEQIDDGEIIYITLSPGRLSWVFLSAIEYATENNLIAGLPETTEEDRNPEIVKECSVEQLKELLPYVSINLQNIALFAQYDYGAMDPRNRPFDYENGRKSMRNSLFQYYTFEETTLEALEIALQRYQEDTGVTLTFEEIDAFMSQEYEPDGSLRLYNNGLHPEIAKYVRWFSKYVHPGDILEELYSESAKDENGQTSENESQSTGEICSLHNIKEPLALGA